jgi:hypothetical protein
MPPRESRATREGLRAVVYKYAVRKDMLEAPRGDKGAIVDELERAHRLREQLVLIDLERDRVQAEIWAAHPDVGPLLASLEEADTEAAAIADQVRALKAESRSARPDPILTSALRQIWARARELREQVKAAKKAGRPLVAGQLEALDKARDAAVKAEYAPAVESGLCWHTVNEVTAKHNTAVSRLIQDRKDGRRARLWPHEWDGTGTLRVQLQRPENAPMRTPRILAVTRCPASGRPASAAIRGKCQSCGNFRFLPATGRLNPHRVRTGPHSALGECPGTGELPGQVRCPDCDQVIDITAGVISGHWQGGRWRNVAAIDGWRDETAYAATSRSARKHVSVLIRIGQGDTERFVTIPIYYHRALPDGADISEVRYTRRKVGRRYKAHVTFTCLLPTPVAPADGSLAVAHVGWRALPDGALRVAVVSGPGRPPAELTRENAVRWHGTWGEVVIPARRRSYREYANQLQGTAAGNMAAVREWLTGWADSHPETVTGVDPDGTLATSRRPAGMYEALRYLSGQCPGRPVTDPDTRVITGWEPQPGTVLSLGELYAQYPSHGEPLVRMAAWARQDRHLMQWAAEARENVILWRRDLFAKVAAWLTEGAVKVALSDFQAPRRPGLAVEDLVAWQKARGNAALAAPGELLSAIRSAAARRGVQIADAVKVNYGTHHGCGGELPRDARAKGVMVVCTQPTPQPGGAPPVPHVVDQDVNALRALAAAAVSDDLAETA